VNYVRKKDAKFCSIRFNIRTDNLDVNISDIILLVVIKFKLHLRLIKIMIYVYGRFKIGSKKYRDIGF